MIDIIMDTLIDALKLLPFLFVAFLLIELVEHKLSKKSKNVISSAGKVGPLLGSLFGLIPQCGFSVMATNLYITRIVSLGTLVAIYLSTSDEMLPVLLSEKADPGLIIKILGLKLLIGMMSGFLIDLLMKNVNKKEKYDYNMCDEEHCHCNEGIFKSAVIHVFKTLLFIIMISFILNLLLNYVGEEYLSKIFLKNSVFGPFLIGFVGLIPNCGASVMITELYLNSAVSFGSMMSGLLSGSGVAILVLLKSEKTLKKSFKVIGLLYCIGVISGLVIDLLNIVV